MPWQLIAAAVGAVAAYFLADEVVQETTGKPIHQHLYGWWCDLVDAVTAWQSIHGHLTVVRFVGKITKVIDDHVSAAKAMITLDVVAEDSQGVSLPVTSRRIPADQLAARYPDLARKREIALDLAA